MPLSWPTKVQVLDDLHFRVERRRFRQVADALLDLHAGCSSTSKPATLAVAGRGREEAGQDAHRGGLPGAVGAEEADDLALFHLEGDVVYRDRACVSLGKTFDFDHIDVPDQTDVKRRPRKGATTTEFPVKFHHTDGGQVLSIERHGRSWETWVE